MTNPNQNVEVSPDDVAALLEQLKLLHVQVAETRAARGPIEANLEQAKKEYQDTTNPLRRELNRLQGQIAELRYRIESLGPPQPDGQINGSGDKGGPNPTGNGPPLPPQPPQLVDPDEIDKDKLLEHVYRMLDPMINPADAELVGQLQGLCTSPTTKLADVLESLDWGPIWEQKGQRESTADQFRRLSSWERALTNQLAGLRRAVDLLHKDPRYGLWQQRQSGAEAWRSFLDRAAQQFRSDIDEQKAQLAELERQWAQIVKEQ